MNLQEMSKEELISEIEKVIAEKQEIEKKNNALLDHSPACTKIIDLDFNLQYMSSSGIKSMRIDDITKLYGKPYPLHFYPEPFKSEMHSSLVKCKKEGEVITYEGAVSDLENRELWFHSTLVPINDDKGNLDFIMIVSVETTERKLMEQKLIVAKDNAEEASEAKGRFLAIMSHEIRTPLNGVVGLTDLLMNTELSPEQKKYAQIIHNSSDVLLRVIGDVLDFSKIDAGQMSIHPVPTILYSNIQEVITLMNSAAQESNIELILKYDQNIPSSISLDPVRIKQILLNLIGNAIKFTEGGYIFITAFMVNSKSAPLRLRIEIIDNGIGIPEGKTDHIFKRFTQADSSTTRRYGGTGLGLAICQKLVGLMGGEIGVDSTVGQGSTFWIEIPTIKAVSRGNSEQPKFDLDNVDSLVQSQNILVVDDSPPNLDVLSGYLTSWDVPHHCVAAGKDALTEIEKAEKAGLPYTMCLIEYVMPDMSGADLARAIHARTATKYMPLIIVTAAYKIENEPAGFDAEFADCILKPIYASELIDTLLDVVTLRSNQGDVPRIDLAKIEIVDKEEGRDPVGGSEKVYKATFSIDGRKPKILLVEDSYVGQMIAQEMLNELGCEVTVAKNGVLAFDAYRSDIKYDLIVMDCMMPEMDGYEATHMIRKYENDNNNGHTPIVAMTANAMQGDRSKCLKAGMDDYISKPARYVDIKRVLKKHLVNTA